MWADSRPCRDHNCSLPGIRVFVDIISQKYSDEPSRARVALGSRRECMTAEKGHVGEAEGYTHVPWASWKAPTCGTCNWKEPWKHHPTGFGDWAAISLTTFWLWTSDFWVWERTHFCCSKVPSLWKLLTESPENWSTHSFFSPLCLSFFLLLH